MHSFRHVVSGLQTGIAAASLFAALVRHAAPAAQSAAPPAPAAVPAAATATPARAPNTMRAGPLVNPGFESAKTNRRGEPEGWFTFQHAGDISYEFVVDDVDPHTGKNSLRISNIGPEPYGAIAQSIDATPHIGRVARLTGWLKTRDAVDNGAVLTLLVLQGGATQAQNFMADARVKGTTGWTRYTITVPIGKGADRIEVGAMMRGRGSLWFDDAEIEFIAP